MEYEGKHIDACLLECVKKQVTIGFMFLSITKSTDEEKQKALDRLKEIGQEAADLLDVIIPWKIGL